MRIAAKVFAGLNVVDAATSVLLYRRGGYELNYIMRSALGHSFLMFGLIKMGLAIAVALILILIANRCPQYSQSISRIFTVLVVGMSIVCALNATQLIIAV